MSLSSELLRALFADLFELRGNCEDFAGVGSVPAARFVISRVTLSGLTKNGKNPTYGP
jgi:hypothetical protein